MNTYFRVLYKDGFYYPQLLQKKFLFKKWVYLSLFFGTNKPFPHSSIETAVDAVTTDIKRSLLANVYLEHFEEVEK